MRSARPWRGKGEAARLRVVGVLGIGQLLTWGSTYYLPAVLAKPTAEATGWPLAWIISGLSFGLLISGLISPAIGTAIERRGGRPVLMASAVLSGAGLLGLAAAPNLAAYIAAWLVLGVAMGAGLYDPAFAALGRLYGGEAHGAITSLTLIAGFASTIGWPLSAIWLGRFGWRGTCVAYALVELAVVLPVYGFGLPSEAPRPPPSPAAARIEGSRRGSRFTLLFSLLALSQTLAAMIAAIVSVHLLATLGRRGVPLATAVALGALVGPSQVGARLLDLMAGRRVHPIWAALIASVFVTLGLGLLLAGYGALWVGLVLYGGGIGLRSIVRGTLPLALFGAEGYASLMGRLAFPMLAAQAAAPWAGAVLLERYGADGVLGALFWLSVASLLSAALLIAFARPLSAA